MSFEKYYLASLFQETGENISALEKSSAIRNSLVRLHNEGINSLSNAGTCTILDQRLSDYSHVSNEESTTDMLASVNNLLKGKVQTRHCVNWQSTLRHSKIKPKEILMKSLERSGHCNAKKGGACDADRANKEGLNKLFKKFPQTPQATSGLSSFHTKEQIEITNTVLQNEEIHKLENSKDQRLLNKLENSLNAFEKELNKINHQPQTSSNLKYNKGNIAKNSDNLFSINHSNSLKSSHNTNPQQPIHNQGQYENNMWKKVQRNTMNIPKGNENNHVNNASTFRTARTELQIQNKKKYGNQSAPELNTVVKRSLGTTRSNVQSKFVPPFSASSDSQPLAPEEESIEDERLKHIDPKMIEIIQSEIIDSSAPIGWDDIAGLEFAKSAIQEAVVWPLLRPDIFTGLRRPPKGILLFGPPGTGKTLIGKCIASQCCATFFSISASSLTSKWIGDGEKMVRALFAVARCHQPAVVFIDEIDSLLTQRSDTEHEASRRIKTEFLVQLDGAATGDDDRFLVIGATNRPQELDEAARRRLVKRLYIPLPDINARQQIIVRLMSTERNSLTKYDIGRISQMTDGYSGADMRSLCSEAALGPIRAVPLSQITNIQCDQVRPVNAEDFERALTRVRPSVSSKDLEHYTIWDRTYGSGSTLV